MLTVEGRGGLKMEPWWVVSEIRNKVNSDPDPYKSERKGKEDNLSIKPL
jgi:hypothetical protein